MPGGAWDGPEGREKLFLEVRTRDCVGGVCRDVFRICVGHGEYEIEICFVCMV